jgi:hypothetical protein
VKLPEDDRQVELGHILSLHRQPAMNTADGRTLYEPTHMDYTAGDKTSGTGTGSQKTDKKPETY